MILLNNYSAALENIHALIIFYRNDAKKICSIPISVFIFAPE